MSAAFLITFRETLEASIVIAIVLSVLSRMGRNDLRYSLWYGVCSGLLVSLAIALGLQNVFGDLPVGTEQIAEGVTMLIATLLITWTILWMARFGATISSAVDARAACHADRGSMVGIFLMSFVAVVREGTETVLFLRASLVHAQPMIQHVGAFLGIALALGVSMLAFRGIMQLSMAMIFRTTSILLIFFAAGLLAHAFHELQEAGYVSWGSAALWDINPLRNADGTYPLLHDHGFIGGILRSLFGYSGDPTGLELVVYAFYIVGIVIFLRILAHTPRSRDAHVD